MNKQKTPFLLTFSDLCSLLRKQQKKFLFFGLLGSALALFYALFQPIEYEAEATFKDKGKSQAGLSKSISELFFLAAESSESEALMMMKSRRLYETLVQQTGMQASLAKQQWAMPLLSRVKNNFIAEYAAFNKSPKPLLEDTVEDIKVNSVHYEGEIPLVFNLLVHSETHYILFDENGRKVADGLFESPLILERFSINLAKLKSPLKGNSYALTVQPLGKTAEKVAKKFRIEPDRFDKSFLKIFYRHPNRHKAAQHLSNLMAIYKEYLQQEHERLATMQVAYLQKRQHEMSLQLDKVMLEHANELASDLSATGFSNSEKAMEFFASAQQNIKQKLLAITLELSRIDLVRQETPVRFERFASILSNNNEIVSQIAKEIRLLNQEAEAIRQINNQQIISQEQREEFQGINLSTAKDLYLNYSQELSQLESQTLQLQFILKQINEVSFEISSLSTILSDPVSIEMISKASALSLSLMDKENRSQKELERLQADFAIQKGILISHLTQTVSLLNIRQALLKSKIGHLQKVVLERTQDQISILEKQLDEYSYQNLGMLKQEKRLLEESLAELRDEMSKLPHKWTAESVIDHQLELNHNMIEEITKLVESKNISSNLELIQSAPVDHPLVPLHPVSPRFILISMLGACLGMVLCFAGVLGVSIKNGVKASQENLLAAGFHVSGKIFMKDSTTEVDFLHDTDLHTLRRLLNYASEPSHQCENSSRALLIMCNRGPYYVWSLAALLLKKGIKVLVVDLCFDQTSTKVEGVLQYLERPNLQEPLIIDKEGIDFLCSGGISRFGGELIGSMRFKQLLSLLLKKYEWVLAYNNSSLNSTDAETLFSVFSISALTVSDETLDDIQLCLEYAGDSKNKVSFLFS